DVPIYSRTSPCLVFLVLVLCVVQAYDHNPSFSCPLVELNLSPQFVLLFLVANGTSRDCQGVFCGGGRIIRPSQWGIMGLPSGFWRGGNRTRLGLSCSCRDWSGVG
nr:hypothetical protein [Tanacetum cinerariifolium]